MSNTIKGWLLLLAISVIAGSCSKLDWNDVWGDHPSANKGDVAAFRLTYYDDYNLPYPFLFAKTYDASGNYVKEINAAFNNVALPNAIRHYRLRLEYRPRVIYFIRMEAPFDTVVTALFNHQGRVIQTNSKNEVVENKFEYRNNRLFSIFWRSTAPFAKTDTCVYDKFGNILSIAEGNAYGRTGYFYEYDYSRKARQQYYMEELRNINNDFTLMVYMGFFPELNPVHLRTAARMGEESVYTFNYFAFNHVFDSKGRLIKYTVYGNPDGLDTPVGEAFITWNNK